MLGVGLGVGVGGLWGLRDSHNVGVTGLPSKRRLASLCVTAAPVPATLRLYY